MKLISKILILFLFSSTILFAASVIEQLKQADKFQEDAQYAKAIDLYSKILDKDAHNPKALFGRAQCYLMTAELDKVIQDLNLYIKIDTLNPDVYNMLGLAKLYGDSALYCLNDFNKAIELDSNFEQAYLNRASFNIAQLFDPVAEEDLKKAIEINPNNPITHNYYGFVLHRMEKYELAVNQFNIAISLGLDSADIFLKRGNSFFKLKKYQEAIGDYTHVIELDSSKIEALNNRAFAYHQLGDEVSAVRDKQLIIEMSNSKDNAASDGVDITKLKFFQHPSEKYSIEMPAEFNNFAYADTFALVQFTTKEKIKSANESFSVGVIIEYIEDTQSKLGMSTSSELVGYCKGLVANAMQDAVAVQPYYEKQKNLTEGVSYQINKFSIKFTKDSPKLVMYMVQFIQDNLLVNLQFVYPEEFDLKYDPMVQNSIKSFKYKQTNKN